MVENINRHAALKGLSGPLLTQATRIVDLFGELQDAVWIPVVCGVFSGLIPFVVVALIQQRMQDAGLLVPQYIDVLVSVFLVAAFPIMALIIVSLQKWKYNKQYAEVAEKIKNTLAEEPELQEALTVVKSRDIFVNRRAKMLGLI